MQKQFFVCLMGSGRNGTLYVGMTSSLPARVYQHKNEIMRGFTSDYGVKHLLWYEASENAESAIIREKQIKKWRRAWKIELIEISNPYWRDLYDDIL